MAFLFLLLHRHHHHKHFYCLLQALQKEKLQIVIHISRRDNLYKDVYYSEELFITCSQKSKVSSNNSFLFQKYDVVYLIALCKTPFFIFIRSSLLFAASFLLLLLLQLLPLVCFVLILPVGLILPSFIFIFLLLFSLTIPFLELVELHKPISIPFVIFRCSYTHIICFVIPSCPTFLYDCTKTLNLSLKPHHHDLQCYTQIINERPPPFLPLLFSRPPRLLCLFNRRIYHTKCAITICNRAATLQVGRQVQASGLRGGQTVGKSQLSFNRRIKRLGGSC